MLSATAVEFGGSLFERSERTVTGGARDKGGRGGGWREWVVPSSFELGATCYTYVYSTLPGIGLNFSGLGLGEVRKGKLERSY